jgi:Tfp pilus assembly PilM family ATPase
MLSADPSEDPFENLVTPERLEKTCGGLVEEVGATLRYYGTQKPSARVGRLHVSGQLARVNGFIDLLRCRLGIDVEPWNPLAPMPCEGDEACQALIHEAGASMAVATGLAMRAI